MEVGGTFFITVHPSPLKTELQRDPWLHSSSGRTLSISTGRQRKNRTPCRIPKSMAPTLPGGTTLRGLCFCCSHNQQSISYHLFPGISLLMYPLDNGWHLRLLKVSTAPHLEDPNDAKGQENSQTIYSMVCTSETQREKQTDLTERKDRII